MWRASQPRGRKRRCYTLPRRTNIRSTLRTLAQTAAQAALRATGLVPGNVTTVFDCNHIGEVTGQSPTAGTQVLPGWPVNIAVGSMRDPTNPRRVCQ